MGTLFIVILVIYIVLLGGAQVLGWTGVFAGISAIIAGTLGFWVFLFIELCFLLYCLDNNSEEGEDKFYVGWSTLSVLLVMTILQLGTSWKPLTYIIKYPLNSLLYCALYVLLGIAWSFGKWWFFNKKHNRRIDKIRKQFLDQEKIEGDKVPEEKLLQWDEYYSRDSGYGRHGRSLSNAKVKASDYKAMLVGWMALWPVSFVWTMINDPIVRFFNRLYEVLQHSYQGISDRVFANVTQEVDTIARLREAEAKRSIAREKEDMVD